MHGRKRVKKMEKIIKDKQRWKGVSGRGGEGRST